MRNKGITDNQLLSHGSLVKYIYNSLSLQNSQIFVARTMQFSVIAIAECLRWRICDRKPYNGIYCNGIFYNGLWLYIID